MAPNPHPTLLELLRPCEYAETKEEAAEQLGTIVRQWRAVRDPTTHETAEKEVRAAIAYYAFNNFNRAEGERIKTLFNVAMPPDPKDAYDAGRGMGEYIKKAGIAPPIDAEAESRTLESELAQLDALVGDVEPQEPEGETVESLTERFDPQDPPW